MWHTWLILISCGHMLDCCRFGPHPNCGFRCRCTGANECNSDTGECSPGSQCQSVLPEGYGWAGQGCLIGNVAFGKSNLQQLGQWAFYSADLAVDGDVTPYVTGVQGESCSHPLTRDITFAWWWVDLGDLYNIKTIIIVNRQAQPDTGQPQPIFNDRSTDYDIKIGNNSNRSQHTLCFHQDKPGDQVQPVETITCNQGDMVGRYVSFARTGGRNPYEAVICEFITMGHKYIECSLDFCNGKCDPVTGCDTCAAGKKLPYCKEDCPAGYWGVNCANQCGMCRNGIVCDPVTGVCEEQCDGWYLPDMCTRKLEVPSIFNPIVEEITADSAVVLWERSSGYADNTQSYFYYIVRYGANDSDVTIWFESGRLYISDVKGLSFQNQLTNLVYNTEYGVQIIPYGDVNGLKKEGNPVTVGFKTKCIAPPKPSQLSVIGSPEVFKVFWKMIDSSNAGCDHIENLQVFVECHNSTHTTNKTTDIAPTATEFFYSAETAYTCTIWLVVSNNEGLFNLSDKVTLSVESTQRPDLLITQDQTPSQLAEYRYNNNVEPLNIPAIAIGASLGTMVLGLIIAVILMVLRQHRFHKTALEDNQKAANSLYEPGNPNPVFDAADGAMNNYYNAKYESVDNTRGNRDTRDTELTERVIYENTGKSHYESVNQAQRVIADTVTPVYQELKQ